MSWWKNLGKSIKKGFNTVQGVTDPSDIQSTQWENQAWNPNWTTSAAMTDAAYADPSSAQGYGAAMAGYGPGAAQQNILAQAMGMASDYGDPQGDYQRGQQAMLAETLGQQMGQAQAQQQSAMAARGLGGGGLRDMLSTRSQAEAGQQLRQGAGDISQRGASLGMQALGQAGQMAGQMESNMLQQALANQAAQNQASQFGASAQNQLGMANLGNQQQANLANQAAMNQNMQFNASNQMNQAAWNSAQNFAANQFNASQNNALVMGNAANRGQFWGDIAGAVGNAVSDIRLKENIDLIGQSPNGVNIYEFDYKDKSYGNSRYRGVMAQEVPYASSVNDNGYLSVDYSKLDVNFEDLKDKE